MTTKKRIRKIYEARQAELAAAETVERDLCSLKPGDEVWFATGFYTVFDVYVINPYTTVLKLIIPACKLLPEHIETHRIRGTDKFLCRV